MKYDGQDITVVTPTIPGRNKQLAQALESVRAQTVKPDAHVVVTRTIDLTLNVRARIAMARNQCIRAVETQFVAFLDDDNAWLPNHLESLLRGLNSTSADVTYSPCLPVDLGTGEPRVFNGLDVNLILELGRVQHGQNLIDTNCLVRTKLLKKYPFEEHWIGTPARCQRHGTCISEDHDLFTTLIDTGATFKWVPNPTWIYSVDNSAFKSSRERRMERGNR